MRTLERNKTKLWYVAYTGEADVVDDDGFKTGEVTKTYSSPSAVYISLYPSSGLIVEQLFGKDASYDMIAVTSQNERILNKEDLLFLSEPLSNYDTTYDFRVDRVLTSLNGSSYGLRRRT